MNKLNLVCPINSLGYGISSYNIWNSLRKKCQITLFPIGNANIESHWDKDGLLADIKRQHQYDKNNPALKIWHAHDLLMKPHGSGKYYTYTFFETDIISDSERVGYNISDIIIAPTQWAKEVLVKNNIPADKIKVASPGVDCSIFNHELDIIDEDSQEDYIFINIGKWEIRKGHDILVHMFNQAFDTTDNVRLVMINTNPFISEKENKQWQDLYKNTKLGDKIYIIPRLSSQADIAKIMKISDCGIFPARAEGWNNEAIEMMAMNKPVILTNYAGHTEYATNDNSYLIDINSHESAHDGKFFDGTGQWAKLDAKAIDQAVEYMRYVYKHEVLQNPAGLKTAQSFSWELTSDKILEIIHG